MSATQDHGNPRATNGGERETQPQQAERIVVPPTKFYSTGEVIEHTGLSRQTLHNYKRLGLIEPARWTKGGHCYYDEAIFARLRKIKMFQRHASLQEIRALLDKEQARAAGAQPGAPREQLPSEAGSDEVPADKSAAAEAEPDESAPLLDAPDANLPDATQWSDNDQQAPQLAQALLQAQRFPQKLYRIGDLMRLTGYSRQTLHNYTIQGLLQTKDHTANGHRLYGADAFTVLRLIEVLKRHRRIAEVQALIEQWHRSRRVAVPRGQFQRPDNS